MGCVCCSLSSFISIVLDALERISLCTVCALLTCCLMFTLIAVLLLGIGIGFHYCFVQSSVEAMAKAAKSAAARRSGGDAGPLRAGGMPHSRIMQRVENAMRRGLIHKVNRSRRDADNSTADLIGSYDNYTNYSDYTSIDNSTLLKIPKNSTFFRNLTADDVSANFTMA